MEKSPIEILLKPVNRFIHREFTGGIVLFSCVVLAIFLANSPWQESYFHFWEQKFVVDFDGYALDKPLHVWINDGLMALFFFVIGLELKREFMAGELSTPRKAALPMIAALGGMIVPAIIYVLFNVGGSGLKGWGIPMATDIAFALALLSLSGKGIPSSVKVFLSALAVADDLGAVLVIAFFYTAHISAVPLLIGGALLLLLLLGNYLGVRSTGFYLVIGIAVWIGFLLSGVHATIAGVLVAFTIPARTKIDEEEFIRKNRQYADKFAEAIPLEGTLTTPEQHDRIQDMKKLCLAAETPLQKIEENLHPWVSFVVMPLFALANSGMILNGDFLSMIANPISLGIVTGLVVGKFIGVFSFTWLSVRFKIGVLPERSNWMHILGVSVLAGVGFTMSLFVTGLAFKESELTDQAKYGILTASALAGIAGTVILKIAQRRKKTSS
ncbi:Na+/H+ antiporter NhaA [Fluviicola chungangensis]|uniref:Na(+)/H(+) antiporter NhaA n=1 Tax=Fluviicola chungangensis TaxID=2597671 RepID=A0A556MNM6_9FLAO|nr:Na+/H+ antiporter NhaA [Fluviicola chungangensis]TSJ41309.1 Na+/H+ antiporter NhaA [Fluviicola chungangensis]